MEDLELNIAIDKMIKEAEKKGTQKVISWLRAQHWSCAGIADKFKEWEVR